MWRHEERLSYWLARAKSLRKPGFAGWFRTRIAQEILSLRRAQPVCETSLSMSAEVVEHTDELSLSATVSDGLAILLRHWDRLAESKNVAGRFKIAIHDMDLVNKTDTRRLELPEDSNIAVKREEFAVSASPQSLSMKIPANTPRSVPCFSDHPVRVHSAGRNLSLHAKIGTVMKPISDLPYMRLSLKLENLKLSEKETFLREAGVLKNIPLERAELLAVFRHVPIELISRLRFLEEKRVLLFTLSEESRTKTRIHDMAAVRDKANKEIYMVPHRTQFRSVSLN